MSALKKNQSVSNCTSCQSHLDCLEINRTLLGE